MSDTFPEPPPDELEMVLTHEDNDDPCEAYPSEQLRFDLTPIRERYDQGLGQRAAAPTPGAEHRRAASSTGSDAATEPGEPD